MQPFIYNTLSDFNDNFENDFFQNFAPQNYSFFDYLNVCKSAYETYIGLCKTKINSDDSLIKFYFEDILNLNENVDLLTDKNEIEAINDVIGKNYLKIEDYTKEIENVSAEVEQSEKIVLKIFSQLEILKDRLKSNSFSAEIQKKEDRIYDIPELDFSNNSDKVKLIMLEKLGVIDYIKTIQTKPETISHTSEILSTITGIPSKTLNTYLSPMIRPHRDDNEKNSPYKNPENRETAERELIKLKIKNIDANR